MMTSYSGLGLGLSVLFGCLLLALVAELYYLIWWKKRVADIEMHKEEDVGNRDDVLHLDCCFKKPSSSQMEPHERTRRDAESTVEEPDLELGSTQGTLLKALGDEGVESELMSLYNLAGPPRFLFTIKEESKEDLESDDGRSRGASGKGSRTRSLSDLAFPMDTHTPFLSPLHSSPLKSQSLDPCRFSNRQGANPLFESSVELGLKRQKTSPPPKFKFLRDAEEKLYQRLTQEGLMKSGRSSDSKESGAKNPATGTGRAEGKDEPFLKFLVPGGKEFHRQTQFPSTSSQILTYGVLPYIIQPT